MANIYKTRDRDAKVITMYVESAQTTSGTTPKLVSFNPNYVKGRMNEPYAVEGCLFLVSSGTTDDLTISFDAGAGSLVLEGINVSATVEDSGAGVNALTTSAVDLLLDVSVIPANGGVWVSLAGTWVPSLRDTVTLTLTSAGATDTHTIQKGSWLKFTRLSD